MQVHAGGARPGGSAAGQSAPGATVPLPVSVLPPLRFFLVVLDYYNLQMAHLNPNDAMTLAIFAHLCEMFVGC
uniref:Transposase (putative) gypsy type domain-containing protein n=1 Tax=Oryza punctata TaxID=4537 RepID=A0A0E0LBI5_ORYPU